MRRPALLSADGVTPLRRRASVDLDRPATAYRGADPGGAEVATWMPGLSSADAGILGSRDLMVSRARDLARNHGWASGAVSRYVDSVIGANLRWASQPDWRSLGITRDQAAELSLRMEAEWRSFANDPLKLCDLERRHRMGGLFGLAFRHQVVDGDGLLVLHWRPDRGGRFATCVQGVDPDRLSTPVGVVDGPQMRAGVELDADGAAVAYHVRDAHPADWGLGFDQRQLTWTRVPRETPMGRPVAIHHYGTLQYGQHRGVSAFAPILREARVMDRYTQAELGAAILNAILAAYIESPLDPDLLVELVSDDPKMSAYQQYRDVWAEERGVTLGGNKLAALAPGEKIGFINAARPASQFGDFMHALQANLSAGFTPGLSLEQFTGDWSRSNYSSARGGMVEAAKTVVADRLRFQEDVADLVKLAVIEEAVLRGRIPLPAGAPDFHEAYTAYLAGRWIGPGRGWVDPVKEAQAAQIRMQAGISTLEHECAEQGLDWEEVVAQRARELQALKEAGLPAGGVDAMAVTPRSDIEDRETRQ